MPPPSQHAICRPISPLDFRALEIWLGVFQCAEQQARRRKLYGRTFDSDYQQKETLQRARAFRSARRRAATTTSPKQLRQLALTHPLEVLANPCVPLISLTEPKSWLSIVARATPLVPAAQQRAAEARLLPLLEPLSYPTLLELIPRIVSFMHAVALQHHRDDTTISPPWRPEWFRAYLLCSPAGLAGRIAAGLCDFRWFSVAPATPAHYEQAYAALLGWLTPASEQD